MLITTLILLFVMTAFAQFSSNIGLTNQECYIKLFSRLLRNDNGTISLITNYGYQILEVGKIINYGEENEALHLYDDASIIVSSINYLEDGGIQTNYDNNTDYCAILDGNTVVSELEISRILTTSQETGAAYISDHYPAYK